MSNPVRKVDYDAPLVVALMGRVSSDEQRKGDSVDVQLAKCRAHAVQLGAVVATYVGNSGVEQPAEFKEDESGFEYTRPEMDIIRDLARRGAINGLIVAKVDRFARDELVHMLLEREFHKYGVRLFSVKEGEFTPGKVNPYVAAFQRTQSQQDAVTSKDRMREMRYHYLQNGAQASQGKPMFGYDKTGKKGQTRYIINEEQAEIIRRIYRLYVVDRMSLSGIARLLNDENVPTPARMTGLLRHRATGIWTDKIIHHIVRNTAYGGKLPVFSRNSDMETQYNDIPPIIDKETWEKTQHLNSIAQRLYNRRTPDTLYLMSCLLTCSCGKAISPHTNKNRVGKTYRYYACNSRKKFSDGGKCGLPTLSATLVDTKVWEFVKSLLTDTRATVARYREEQAALEDANVELRARIEAIDELVAEQQMERSQVELMFRKRRIPEESFDFQCDQIDATIAELQRRRAGYAERLAQSTITDEQIASIEEIGNEINAAVEEPTFEKKRSILERMRITGRVEQEDGWIVVYITIYSRSWPVQIVCHDTGTARRRANVTYTTTFRILIRKVV